VTKGDPVTKGNPVTKGDPVTRRNLKTKSYPRSDNKRTYSNERRFKDEALLPRAPFESNRIELRQIRFDQFKSNLCRSSIRSELANIRRIFDVRRTPVT
jgi:hypothetical protein